ncbi:MAG: hypothetical protein KKG88_10960 [Proteobacteria bacterium]|nr:hypothetical protein [Pseudomonadota bacterium]
MSSFKEKIQKNKIRQPTQAGFNLGVWESEWEKELGKSASDAEIYLAGRIIFEILHEIRNALNVLCERFPNIRNEDLIKIYIALSNRDRTILSKYTKDNYKEAKNIFSATISAGPSGNELTLQEVADNCVDGIENAIKQCAKRRQKNQGILNSENPLDVMEFISRESTLSQLYHLHESYWHALLWGEYRFIEKDKTNRIYAVVQEKTALEVSAVYSQIRKQKLEIQFSTIAVEPEISKHFNDDKYVSITKNGKKQSFLSKKIVNAEDETIYLNSAWRSREIYLTDEFPVDVLQTDSASGFSILDALNVARCLVILAWQFIVKYPHDDSAYGVNKLLQFCPRVNKLELAKGLAKATGYDFPKVIKILEFIEYRGCKGQDLWCHPLVLTRNTEYAVLTSALITPSMIRLVEHWLVQLNMDISEKGNSYEKTVIQNLNSAIRDNKQIGDFDEGVCRRFKLKSGEEEIDLLVRFGHVVLLGEAKSIVTTDSPISQHRALATLQHAASQVKRKREFLIENMKEIFSTLGWKYDCETNYEVVECIINSGRMFVGSCVDNIPVVDEKVLAAYFRSNTIPLFSRFEKGNSYATHLSWFCLYDKEDDLRKNIKRYLASPPQIVNDENGFEYSSMIIPCIGDDPYKIIYARLVPKDVQPTELLGRTYSFPIESVKNIEEELACMDLFF